MSDVRVTIRFDTENAQAFRQAGDEARRGLGTVVAENQKVRQATEDVARSVGRSLALTAALLTGFGFASVNAASDFESSFAGVKKTVDATDQEFQQFEVSFRDMAKEIPVGVNQINRVAEAAGQLGIEKKNIVGFTETMSMLGVTTNMASAEAATSLARLANITQMPQTQFDRLGSTVVDLGNNLATTESEIVDFGLRIAGAGSQIGLTEAQILSIGGALSSVGIQAEAGGTSISRVMIEIANSVASGGDKLEKFAEIAGMSADDFKASFEKDAAGALVAFVSGLGRVSDEGGNVFATLESVEFQNIRVRDALLRASGAGDLLARSLEIGTRAWKDNTALTEEASKRFETFESKVQILKNRFNDLLIVAGDAIIPVLIQVADAFTPILVGVTSLAESFDDLPTPVKSTLVVLGGALTALSGVSGAALMAIPSILRTQAALTTLAASSTGAAAAVTVLKVALAVGLVAAAAAAGIAIGLLINKGMEKLGITAADMAEKIGLIPAAIDRMDASMEGAREGMDQTRKKIEFVNTVADKWRELTGERLPDSIRSTIAEGKVLDAQMQAITDAMNAGGEEGEILRGIVSEVSAEMNEAAKAAREHAAATGESTDANDDNADSANNQVEAYNALENALGRARDALPGYTTNLDTAAQILAVASGAQDKVNKSLEELRDEALAGKEALDEITESVELSDEVTTDYGATLSGLPPTLRELRRHQDDVAVSGMLAQAAYKTWTQQMDPFLDALSLVGVALGVVDRRQQAAGQSAGLLSRAWDGLLGSGQNLLKGMAGLGKDDALTFGSFFEGALGRLGSGIMDGLGRILADGIAGVVNMAVSALSQGVAKLVGAVVDAFSESTGESLQSDFAKNYGIQVGEQFADGLGESFGRDGSDAVLRGLDQIVAEVGQLDLSQFRALIDTAFKAVTQRFQEGKISAADFVDALSTSLPILAQDMLRFVDSLTQADFDAFLVGAINPLNLVRDGTLGAADAAQIYDATLEDLIPVFAAFEGGQEELNRLLREADELGIDLTDTLDRAAEKYIAMGDDGRDALIALAQAARASGVEIEAIENHVADLQGRAMSLIDERTDLLVDRTQQAVDAVVALTGEGMSLTASQARTATTTVAALYDELLRGGVSAREAIELVAPAVEALEGRFKELGVRAPAGLRDISDAMDVLAQGPVQRAVREMDLLGQVTLAAGDAGVLSRRQFLDFGDSVNVTFNRLTRQGMQGERAIRQIAPELQNLLDLSEMYGFRIDANTRRLIDEAMALDLVSSQGLTTEDILIKGFDTMILAVNELIVALGGVPVAFDGIAAAADQTRGTARQAFMAMADDAGTSAADARGFWALLTPDLRRVFREGGEVGRQEFLAIAGAADFSQREARRLWRESGGNIQAIFEAMGLSADAQNTRAGDAATREARRANREYREAMVDQVLPILRRFGDVGTQQAIRVGDENVWQATRSENAWKRFAQNVALNSYIPDAADVSVSEAGRMGDAFDRQAERADTTWRRTALSVTQSVTQLAAAALVGTSGGPVVGMLPSFQTSEGESRIVPGRKHQPRLAIVHGGEEIRRRGGGEDGGEGGVHLHFHGDVYGMDDFETKATEAVRRRLGRDIGFRMRA